MGSVRRQAARVDNNQAEIVDALRRCGVSVEIIGKPFDLVVCCRGETSFVECKWPRPTSEGGSHGLTKDQVEFIARWPGKVHVVRSKEEAIREVLGEKVLA